MPIIRGDDSRRLVPEALVQVLTHLIDRAIVDGYGVADLRSIRRRVCMLYNIVDPSSRASEIDVAQAVAEEDGVPIEE